MPIPGWTTRERLPRIGKIRLGKKEKTSAGKEYPAALDHFNFVDVPELEARFGGNCRTIEPVILPADDEETWFPTARVAYGRSGLFCRCSDGETATRVYHPADAQGAAFIKENGIAIEEGDMFDLPCPGEDCPYFAQKKCKNLGRLFIMLPNIPRFGVYEIATSSFNSMVNVLSTTRAIRRLLGGRIAGIPLSLHLKPMQVQPDGKAKTVYVLEFECKVSLSALASMGKRLSAGGGMPLALIEAPPETPDDLYPRGGEALDEDLGTQPPQEDPHAETRARLHKAGAAIGMAAAQVEYQIGRTPPEHLVDLAKEWEQEHLNRQRTNAAKAPPPPAAPQKAEPTGQPDPWGNF